MKEKISNAPMIMERFTKEQLDDITQLFDTMPVSKTISPLYKRYGVKHKEVSSLYNELIQAGILRDKMRDYWTVEQTKELRSRVEQGYDISEIAVFFKKDRATVRSKIIKEYGSVPFFNLPDEEWRDCVSMEKYQVSNKGRIRDKGTNRIYKGSISPSGYLVFAGMPIHKLVAETFIPNPDNKPIVDHRDTEKTNNNVSNLRWVTQEENMRNEQTRENIRKGLDNKRKREKVTALIEQALDLIPDKLELIQLVIQCSLPIAKTDDDINEH